MVTLKRIEKIVRENAFDEKKKRPGLKFNPGLTLIGLQTTGPRCSCVGVILDGLEEGKGKDARGGGRGTQVTQLHFNSYWLPVKSLLICTPAFLLQPFTKIKTNPNKG